VSDSIEVNKSDAENETAESSIRVELPRIVDRSVDIVSVDGSRMYARYKDSAISIKRDGKRYRISLWRLDLANGGVKPVWIYKVEDPLRLPEEVGSELKEVIKDLVDRWSDYADYIEEEQVAEAVLRSKINIVPKNVGDREALTQMIAEKLVQDLGATFLQLGNSRGKIEKRADLGVHCFNGKAWVPCEESIQAVLKEYLTRVQMAKVTLSVVREIIGNKIKILNTMVVDPEEYNRPVVAFENGIFDWEVFLETGDINKALKPFSRDTFVLHHIPHSLRVDLIKEVRSGLEIYIPPRSCSEVVKLLRALSPRAYELLRSWAWFDGVPDDLLESRICFEMQMIGRALYPGYRFMGSVIFKDIFIVLGPTNAGKTTFLLNLLGELVLGRANFSVTTLSALTTRRADDRMRNLGVLYNVLAVICPDTEKREEVSVWSDVRSISGGDPIRARTLYRDSFDYYPHYKIYIGGHNLPPIDIESMAKDALLERFKVIEFRNRFPVGGLQLSKYLTEADIEAIILASIYALRLVYLNKDAYAHTGVKDVEDLINRYSHDDYYVIMWLVERGELAFDPTLRITSRELYGLVLDKAKVVQKELENRGEDRELNIPDQSVFTKKMKRLLAKFGVTAVSDGNITVFEGIGVPRKDRRLDGGVGGK